MAACACRVGAILVLMMVPQVYQVWRTRSAADLSHTFLGLYNIGECFEEGTNGAEAGITLLPPALPAEYPLLKFPTRALRPLPPCRPAAAHILQHISGAVGLHRRLRAAAG